MAIELAGITLNRIHKLATLESAGFAGHRIPGLAGTVFQDTGRHSTRLLVEGIYYGEKAKEDLEKLRDVYKKREEADFLAEIVGQAYFSQVVIDRLEVFERAGEPEQFSFRMVLAEYVPPPEPEAALGLPGVDDLLSLDALDFMDMLSLPDLLSVPGFGDPTPPLQGILDSAGTAMDGATAPAEEFGALFEGPTSLTSQVEAQADPEAVTGMMDEQLGSLTSADGAAAETLDQTAGQVEGVSDHVSGIAPPVMNPGPQMEQGFSAVQDQLPADPSEVLGGIDGEMDGFFEELNTDLANPFGSVLDNFRSLGNLGIGSGGSSQQPAPPGQQPQGMAEPQVKNARAVHSKLDAILSILPDPLDAAALIGITYRQLASLPRERVALQYIPVYDELRDKLETATTWLEGDGPAIGAHFVQSLNGFKGFIRTHVRDGSLNPVLTPITALQSGSNTVALQRLLTGIPTGLNDLAAKVRAGSLNGELNRIAELQSMVGELELLARNIKEKWMDTSGRDLMANLAVLNETLEERMAQLLLFGAPSPDLSLIALAAQPINKVFEGLGIPAFISGIQEFSNLVAGVLDSLSLDQIGDTVGSAIDKASQTIQRFSDMLVNITLEFTKLINKVEQAIESIGVAELVDELKAILNNFGQQVVTGLNSVFGPVRSFLQDAFDQINNLVAAFDPAIILDTVKELLQTLTDILGNEQLQQTISTIKTTLEEVNTTLGEFQFTVVTDPVVSGIGVVKGVFDIAGKLPLPESVANEVKTALNALPSGAQLRTVSGKLSTGLDTIIEKGPKPVLLAIKDKPAELVTLVEKYNPIILIGDKLSAPYQAFVGQVEQLKPTVLMAPIKAEIDKLLDQLREKLDPTALFEHLQQPFDDLLAAIDNLNPTALIQPLQEKLSAGIHAITERLPLDEADEIFAITNAVAGEITKVLQGMQNVRDTITAINVRLAGLTQSEAQVRGWGDEIAAKLDTIADFAPITTALQAVDIALGEIEATPLQQAIFTPMDTLMDAIRSLNPQPALIAMVQAQRGFPVAQLQAMADSPEKTALVTLVTQFNPLDPLYNASLGGLQDKLDAWTTQKTALTTFFVSWQQNFFGANGALARYRRPAMTLPELKQLMTETISTQLTNAIAPVFRIIDHMQNLVTAILSEMENLVQRLEAQVGGLLQINDALNGLRDAVRSVVDQLNALDITFIAREVESVFDAVLVQLNALNPRDLGLAVKAVFDTLLDSLNPNTLLGLPALDLSHQTLVDLLRERDPKVLLTDKLQPEYDKVVDFLKLFDIRVIIETFILNVEGLQVQLDGELERVIVAYEEMTGAIPGSLSGSLGVSFNASAN